MRRTALPLALISVLLLASPAASRQQAAGAFVPDAAVERPRPPLAFAPLRESFGFGLTLDGPVAAGDLDGDGDVDAVVEEDGRGVVLLNRGDGTFARSGGRLPAAFATPLGQVELADVDQDGDLDVVRAAGVAFNDGTGRFPTATPLPGTTADAFAVEDLDGDLDVDFLQSGRLLLNDGSGGFSDGSSALPPGLPFAWQVLVADVDGDLDADVLLIGFGTRLLLRTAGGSYVDATSQLPVLSGFPRTGVFADVDGDLDPDLLLGYFSADLLVPVARLLENDGSGGFAEVPGALPALSPLEGFVRALLPADLDGDGDLDLLVGTRPWTNFNDPGGLGGEDRVWTNDGGGTFTEAVVLEPIGTTSHARAADVDGDGDPDAVLGHALLLNDGSGVLVRTGAGIRPGFGTTVAVAVADLDGDGFLDAATAREGLHSDARQVVQFGRGTGEFDAVVLPSPWIHGIWSADVEFGDFDGDGDLDVFHVRPWPGDEYVAPPGEPTSVNRLYLNGGARVFTDRTDLLPSYVNSDFARSVDAAVLDADGDGDLDLALARESNLDHSGFLVVFVNDGTGAMAESPVSPYPSQRVAAGDLDLDGAADLVVSGTALVNAVETDGVFDFRNDGTGVFAPSRIDSTELVAAGDVEGDGDLDVVSGSGWHRNDGAGGLALVPHSLPPSSPGYPRLFPGDPDGDGDLDLLGRGVFLEFGNRRWSRRVDLAPPGEAIGFGDFDLDGDVDLFLGREGTDAFDSNLARSLARRGLPRVGRPLRLESYGPPSEPRQLWRSLQRVLVPTPQGLSQLGPNGLTLVDSGVLDADGRATTTLAIPPSPSLIGTTLYWQALVGASPRWTNLEITTFLDL